MLKGKGTALSTFISYNCRECKGGNHTHRPFLSPLAHLYSRARYYRARVLSVQALMRALVTGGRGRRVLGGYHRSPPLLLPLPPPYRPRAPP